MDDFLVTKLPSGPVSDEIVQFLNRHNLPFLITKNIEELADFAYCNQDLPDVPSNMEFPRKTQMNHAPNKRGGVQGLKRRDRQLQSPELHSLISVGASNPFNEYARGGSSTNLRVFVKRKVPPSLNAVDLLETAAGESNVMCISEDSDVGNTVKDEESEDFPLFSKDVLTPKQLFSFGQDNTLTEEKIREDCLLNSVSAETFIKEVDKEEEDNAEDFRDIEDLEEENGAKEAHQGAWEQHVPLNVNDRFVCNICNAFFSTALLCERHQHRFHQKCDECGAVFASQRELSDHRLEHIVCDDCGKRFLKRHDLKLHKRTHTGERPFECEVCLKRFARKGTLRDHLRRHSGEKSMNLPPLSMKIPAPQQLFSFGQDANTLKGQEIRENSHLNSGVVETLVKIENIAEDFGDFGELEKEVKIEEMEEHQQGFSDPHHVWQNVTNRFLCTTCNAHFSTALLLEWHQSHKHPICDECGAAFASPRELSNHRLEHIFCDVCGKHFLRRNDLKLHKRIHTGERPHQCEVCLKCFTRKGTLTDHMRMHTGEKPYECELCRIKFATATRFCAHRRRVHGFALQD